MPPKRRRKTEPDVIKTKPDRRKATGREEDDLFNLSDDDEPMHWTDLPEWTWTTLGQSRAKTRKSVAKGTCRLDAAFPFSRLPPEIRNMIYRYLVISKAKGPIALDEVKCWKPGGIDINILLVNKQTFDEASKILYDENKCVALWTSLGYAQGVAFRVDDVKTTTSTSRTLRSGRAVDMVKHRGLLYEKIFRKLRNVELRVHLFSRGFYCDHIALRITKQLRDILCTTLSGILHKRYESNFGENNVHGRKWEVVLISDGPQVRNLLRKMIEPIDCSHVAKAVEKGNIQLRLEGKYPSNWKKIFRRLEGKNGFVTDKVEIQATEPRGISSEQVDEYFDFEDGYWSA